jgi:hypothetical protein
MEKELRQMKRQASAEAHEGAPKGVNFLEKNKYPFFTILSYNYSRTEAKLLLSKLSKKG